jgi:uncharacterized membrane protein YczE
VHPAAAAARGRHVANVVLIGSTTDVVLAFTPPVHGGAARWACSLVGILGNGVATGLSS